MASRKFITQRLAVDAGLAAFTEVSSSQASNQPTSYTIPPLGTCNTIVSNVVDALNDVLNTENPVPVDDFATALDAGGTLTITGPNGQRVLTNSSGAYAGLLGGIDLELNEAPLYFVQGPYSIAGQGGADVEAFNAQFNLGDPLTLSNSEQLVEVNRNNGFTIRWQGGNADTEQAVILVGNTNLETGLAGLVACVADLGPGSFTVDSVYLGNIPPSLPDGPDGPRTLGFIVVATGPSENGGISFEAPGIDDGQIVFSSIEGIISSFLPLGLPPAPGPGPGPTPPPPSGPDVGVQLNEVLPAMAVAKDRLFLRYSIENVSGFSGDAERSVYLSNDPLISSFDDTLVNTRSIGLTGVNQTFTSTNNALPEGLGLGQHYVGVVISVTGDVNPVNDVSNGVEFELVADRPPFDLSVDAEDVAPATVGAGDPISVTSAVRGKSRHRTVSLDRSMSYGLFCPGTI